MDANEDTTQAPPSSRRGRLVIGNRLTRRAARRVQESGFRAAGASARSRLGLGISKRVMRMALRLRLRLRGHALRGTDVAGGEVAFGDPVVHVVDVQLDV